MSTIFKDRLNEFLQKKQMRQIEIAEKTGISRTTINKYTKGTFSASKENLYKIAKVLDTNPAYLLGWTDNKEPVDDKTFSFKIDIIGDLDDKADDNYTVRQIMNIINNLDDDELKRAKMLLELSFPDKA